MKRFSTCTRYGPRANRVAQPPLDGGGAAGTYVAILPRPLVATEAARGGLRTPTRARARLDASGAGTCEPPVEESKGDGVWRPSCLLRLRPGCTHLQDAAPYGFGIKLQPSTIGQTDRPSRTVLP